MKDAKTMDRTTVVQIRGGGRICAIMAFCAVAVSPHAFAASSSYYVQDGLVAHWDAIDNIGTGTHDNTATIWKNLVKDGMDLTICDAKWVDGKALYNNYPGIWATETGRLAAYGNSTINYVTSEFAISNVTTTSDVGCKYVFSSGKLQGYCVMEVAKTGFEFSTTRPVLNAFGFGSLGYHTLAWENVNGAPYMDGVPQSTNHYQMSQWNVVGGNGYANIVFLGCSTAHKARTFDGKYYAIRLYDRALTADEFKWNALVDRVRFMGGVDGYRDTGTALQRLVSIATPANGTLTVDGVAYDSGLLEWADCDDVVTTNTVTVTPGEGYMFTGWTGTKDAIISSSDDMRTISVAIGKHTVSLTPSIVKIPEPAMAAPVHVITVVSGTRILSSATDDDGNAIGTSGTIVKKGTGTLEIDSDVISGFAGEIVIEAGRWHAIARTGLGAKDGGDVWVADNATLSFHSEIAISGSTTSARIMRRVFLQGNGSDGRGALYGSSGGRNVECYNLFPKNIVLLGDALVGSAQKVNFDFASVELNRHTLTFAPYDVSWDYIVGTFTNGNIAVTNLPASFDSTLVLNGGAENNVVFRKGGGFRGAGYGAAKGSAQGGWTAVFEDGTSFFTYRPDVGIGWNGPVILKGHTSLVSQVPLGWISIWGVVSGNGDFGYDTADNNTYYACLRLANAANSFTGGIYLKQNVLEATVDGAIPVDGGSLNSQNSTVNLSGTEEYHLPDFVITGTGSVYSAASTMGSFKSAMKSGGGAYMWNTKVGACSFALNGGLLAFGENAASGGTVAVDFGMFTAAAGTILDLGGNSWTCTNMTGVTAITNGTFVLDGPWSAVSQTGALECRGTATLSFGTKAVVSLADLKSLRRAETYTLASSSTAITAIPAIDMEAKVAKWRLRLSDDHKELLLFNANGIAISFR